MKELAWQEVNKNERVVSKRKTFKTLDNYSKITEAVTERNMDAVEMLDIITNYLGLQILDDDFMKYLEQEEIL